MLMAPVKPRFSNHSRNSSTRTWCLGRSAMPAPVLPVTRSGAGEGQVEECGWTYRRRQPERTVLDEAVRDNFATLVAEASEVGRGRSWTLHPIYASSAPSRHVQRGLPAFSERRATQFLRP